MKSSKKIKQLKKEIKKLRRLAGKAELGRRNWQERYSELNGYVERVYKDY